MENKLSILAPTRYPWQFNGPRASRYRVCRRAFVPFNKLTMKYEGFTIINPLPPRRFDLVHAFNRIPLGTTPYVIGFESHLPRAFAWRGSDLYCRLAGMLADKRCKGIVAISEYARRQFLREHADQPWQATLAAKLYLRYPNIPIPQVGDGFELQAGAPLRLVFVGHHFGRKGGAVALRLAKLARARDLAVQVDIVSALELGADSWVGPSRHGYWQCDLALLHTLPNVRHHHRLANADVLALIKKAHFVLLPTFSDSFGYSAIEAMAHSTPVIATRQCALPEFIRDGVNGLLLPLETDDNGEWIHVGRQDRDTPAYEALFDAETDRLATEACARIEHLMQTPDLYLSMRHAARATAEAMFDAAAANDFWDNFYGQALTA